MGRTIVADSLIESEIMSLVSAKSCNIGIIIGQLSLQKDFAVHLAQCPEETNTDGVKVKGANQIDTMTDFWLAQHAKQVLRMLPGGLDILGIFAIAPPDVMKSVQPKLRQVLFAVQKVVMTADQFVPHTNHNLDRVLLQICSLTQKTTCRTFDVSDPKSSAKPADWKFQSIVSGFHQIQSSISLDYIIPVSIANMQLTLEKQLLQGVMPMCDNVVNSLVLIDGYMRDDAEPLVHGEPTSKKAGKKNIPEEAGKTFLVQVYNQMHSPNITSHGKQVSCGARLWLRGTLCCRAFVSSKSTVGDAIQAFKQDVVRSLIVRCQLLCEDILQSEEEQDPRVLYETPRRVFAPLHDNTKLLVCDYLFADEIVEDCLQRQSDLLGLEISENDMMVDLEPRPDEKDLLKPEQYVRKLSPTDAPKCSPSTKQSASGIMKAAISLGVAALAAVFSYIYLEDS